MIHQEWSETKKSAKQGNGDVNNNIHSSVQLKI